MRKFLIIGVCIAGFAILAATQGKKCEYPKWMKEAKIEVASIDSGVIIKIISDKPEIVKESQDFARKLAEDWKAGKCIHEIAEEKDEKVKDLMCGMEIEKEKAVKAIYEQKTYYFCSKQCKDSFLKEPEKYIGKPKEEKSREEKPQGRSGGACH